MAERWRGVTDQGTNPGRHRPGTVWNPLGTVPALVLGALMITESSAIACHGNSIIIRKPSIRFAAAPARTCYSDISIAQATLLKLLKP